MSELIMMKRRIKVITTIKKITHAMRLISMSSHTTVKRAHTNITRYTKKLRYICSSLLAYQPDWSYQQLNKTNKSLAPKQLFIVVGSQKGLCGNFNSTVLQNIKLATATIPAKEAHLIIVGKQISQELLTNRRHTIHSSYDQFNSNNYRIIARHIMRAISDAPYTYRSVTIIANEPVTFFTQTVTRHTIFPISLEQLSSTPLEDLTWFDDIESVTTEVMTQYLESSIQSCLIASLLAEHAARFISMDSSTRNADKLLEITKLQYNKLRQATITNEVTELSSNL